MSHSRQVRRLEYLQTLFASHGIRPHTALGQNFLLDKNQVNYIARLGELDEDDLVLEVGPGTGFLTEELLATGAQLLLCEFDQKLGELIKSLYGGNPQVTLILGDILKSKSKINPDVLSILRKWVTARPGAPLKTISNLPYSAGTPFVANLFASDLPWQRAVFLLQLEVVERMVASPGTKSFGTLSVLCALGGKVRLARKVPPQVFWPRPRVDSAVVTIDFLPPAQRLAIPWAALRKVQQAVFTNRRKKLRSAARILFGKAEADDVLSDGGIDGQVRGEDLVPEQFLELAHLVMQHDPTLGATDGDPAGDAAEGT